MGLVVAVSILVLVVALAHLVGGWVYASSFYHRALRVQPQKRTYGVWISGKDRTTVRLTAREPRQDLGHPGTLGVFWKGGYGQVGEVIAVDGLEVTRSWKKLEGEDPPTCPDGILEDCIPVDLEGYAFPRDPSDVALDFADIEYHGPLGDLAAWLIPVEGASRWAIHVHGWTAERREALRLLPTINEAGITSMVIDYRNDLGAPADPSGRYRFGLTEWQDVEAAVRHATENGAGEVVLIGYSTGGAHIMAFLERSPLAAVVVGVILDSPNVLLAEAVRHGSIGLRFGSTPVPVTRLVTEFGMWIADLRWGIDWETTNYVQRAETILGVPTLVFHGTSDHRVPVSVSRQLEARARDMVTLVEAPAAGHVMSWNANPARYEKALAAFLGRL